MLEDVTTHDHSLGGTSDKSMILTELIDGRLRGDDEHFSVGREQLRRRNYTYRYLVPVASWTTAAVVLPVGVRVVR